LRTRIDGYEVADHDHIGAEIDVEAIFDSRCPSTARQQQIAFRSDLVLTLFALLLAFSL
jgi:hypothetical protein